MSSTTPITDAFEEAYYDSDTSHVDDVFEHARVIENALHGVGTKLDLAKSLLAEYKQQTKDALTKLADCYAENKRLCYLIAKVWADESLTEKEYNEISGAALRGERSE